MDGFSFTTNRKQDDSERETAEHIWKMLDELSISDPETYNSFIKKTLSDVPPSLRSKTSLNGSACKSFQVPCTHPLAKLLVLKIRSNPSIPIDNVTQLPVKSTWMPSVEAGNLSVVIEISSKLWAALDKEKEALAELILFASEQVYKVSGIRSQPECFQQLQENEPNSHNLPSQNTSNGIKLPTNFSEKLLAPASSLSKPPENVKILIEELSSSSVTGNSSIPDFNFDVQKTFIQYQIKLPMLESLSDYDLALEGDSLFLSIPNLYEFRHKHGHSVDGDQVTAKFLRKRKILKIILPII